MEVFIYLDKCLMDYIVIGRIEEIEEKIKEYVVKI